MSILNIASQIVSFDASGPYQTPLRTYLDWGTQLRVEDVSNPRMETLSLAPAATVDVFDGTRSLTVDNTTEFSLSLLSGSTSSYRFIWTDGTDPGFRTSRSVSPSGSNITVTVNSNATAVFTSNNSDFSAAQVGDILWIPGTKDGVTSPFSILNQGFWTILAVSATALAVRRSNTFSGYAESAIAVTSETQMEVYSTAGVQIGDKVQISAGFSTAARKTYKIVQVTPLYLEVVSSLPMAAETAILPGSAGMTIFTSLKRWVRIESDQEISVSINGDSSGTQILTPWVVADSKFVAEYVRTGPTYSVQVTSRSTTPARVTVLSVE